jgi:hypothetical protein
LVNIVSSLPGGKVRAIETILAKRLIVQRKKSHIAAQRALNPHSTDLARPKMVTYRQQFRSA